MPVITTLEELAARSYKQLPLNVAKTISRLENPEGVKRYLSQLLKHADEVRDMTDIVSDALIAEHKLPSTHDIVGKLKMSNYGSGNLVNIIARDVANEELAVNALDILREEKFNFSAVDDFGSTPCHTAVTESRLLVLEKLIECGGNFNGLDDDNHTPLSLAASRGKVGVMRVLIAHDANFLDILATDHVKLLNLCIMENDPLSILQLACENGNLSAVKYLTQTNTTTGEFMRRIPSLIDHFIAGNEDQIQSSLLSASQGLLRDPDKSENFLSIMEILLTKGTSLNNDDPDEANPFNNLKAFLERNKGVDLDYHPVLNQLMMVNLRLEKLEKELETRRVEVLTTKTLPLKSASVKMSTMGGSAAVSSSSSTAAAKTDSKGKPSSTSIKIEPYPSCLFNKEKPGLNR